MGCSPSKNALLRGAIKDKNWTKMEQILTSPETKTHLNLNRHGEHENVLHQALRGWIPDDVLLKIISIGVPKGLDLENQDCDQHTVLAAAISRSPDIVNALLDYGAKPGNGLDRALKIHQEQVAKSKFDEYPLNIHWFPTYVNPRKFAAIILEHPRATELDTVKRLWYTLKLSLHPDPIKKHLKDTEKTPSINEPNKNGELLLHKACANKHYPKETLEMIAFLIDIGADVNARQGREDWTPLHVAAHNGVSLFVVQLLLERGADPKAMDINGKTPLHLAMKANEPHLFVALGGIEAPIQEAVLVVN